MATKAKNTVKPGQKFQVSGMTGPVATVLEVQDNFAFVDVSQGGGSKSKHSHYDCANIRYESGEAFLKLCTSEIQSRNKDKELMHASYMEQLATLGNRQNAEAEKASIMRGRHEFVRDRALKLDQLRKSREILTSELRQLISDTNVKKMNQFFKDERVIEILNNLVWIDFTVKYGRF